MTEPDSDPLHLPILIGATLAKATVALLPGGGAALVVWDAVRSNLTNRVQRTADEILALVGADKLAERLAESPEFESVVIGAFQAAAATGYEPKRRLMARVVANATFDEARVDESFLIQQVMRDLDAPHFRALARLRAAELSVPDTNDPQVDAYNRFTPVSRISADTADPVVAALVRTGTATAISAGNAMTVGRPILKVTIGSLTEFGRKVLEEIERA